MNKIISLHIHKTAGSTLHSIISRQYKSDEVIFANLEGVDNVKKEIINNKRNISQLKCVHGHFVFGWHQFLGVEWKYITVIREPRSRLISDYYYNLSNTNAHHHQFAKNKSFNEFLLNPRNILSDNALCRFISGDITTPVGELSENVVKKALKNIDNHFIHIGFTEKFDDFLVKSKKILGWNRLYYKSLNRTKTNRGRVTIDDGLLSERIKYDVQLYNELRNRDNEYVRATKFNFLVLVHKLQCRFYSLIYPLWSRYNKKTMK